MTRALDTRPEAGSVLCKALFNVQNQLGLTQQDIGQVIGGDRNTVRRIRTRGTLDPASKAGELAACLIRACRALYVLMGGEQDNMRHWMSTWNAHLEGVPRELIRSVQGLIRVMEYLDAIRGRV
jgi:hypothetical protein